MDDASYLPPLMLELEPLLLLFLGDRTSDSLGFPRCCLLHSIDTCIQMLPGNYRIEHMAPTKPLFGAPTLMIGWLVDTAILIPGNLMVK